MGSLPSLFPPKAVPAWPTQVADHLIPNQVLGFFEFFREREGGSFLFSKACESLYRRRFREFEDAPFAAYSQRQLEYESSCAHEAACRLLYFLKFAP
jgi:hypothetical protein